MSEMVWLPKAKLAVNLGRVLEVRTAQPHAGDASPRVEVWYGGTDRRHYDGEDAQSLLDAVRYPLRPVAGFKELPSRHGMPELGAFLGAVRVDEPPPTDVESGGPVG